MTRAQPALPNQPLRALWQRHGRYRGRLVAAVSATTVNKIADVMPELLIGAAVDVVVRGDASLVADLLGVESRHEQLAWLAAFNAVVWIIESLTEYVADLLWRGLAQGSSTSSGWRPTTTRSTWRWPGTRPAPPDRPWRRSTTT